MNFPPGIILEQPLRRSKDRLDCEHPSLADGSAPECTWKIGPDQICGHAWNNRAESLRRARVGFGHRPTTPRPDPDAERRATIDYMTALFSRGTSGSQHIQGGTPPSVTTTSRLWRGALRFTVWTCLGYLRWSTDDPDLTVEQCR